MVMMYEEYLFVDVCRLVGLVMYIHILSVSYQVAYMVIFINLDLFNYLNGLQTPPGAVIYSTDYNTDDNCSLE